MNAKRSEIKRRSPRVKGLVRAALVLNVSVGHLSRVVSGARKSAALLERYHQLHPTYQK